MLRSFFMETPKEIEEAAMMDGAGRLQAFLRVIVPITWPEIITHAVTLLLAYNEFLLARILMQSNWTLRFAIAQYTSGKTPATLRLPPPAPSRSHCRSFSSSSSFSST